MKLYGFSKKKTKPDEEQEKNINKRNKFRIKAFVSTWLASGFETHTTKNVITATQKNMYPLVCTKVGGVCVSTPRGSIVKS